MEELSVDNLIKTCKIIVSEYGLARKIMFNASKNFILEEFQEFCKFLNIYQAVS